MTHSEEPVMATPDGPLSTETTNAASVDGSILSRRLAASLTTQTAPNPVAIAVGAPRRAIVPLTAAEFASISEIVASNALTTHTFPNPTEIDSGARPTRIVAVTALLVGSIR